MTPNCNSLRKKSLFQSYSTQTKVNWICPRVIHDVIPQNFPNALEFVKNVSTTLKCKTFWLVIVKVTKATITKRIQKYFKTIWDIYNGLSYGKNCVWVKLWLKLGESGCFFIEFTQLLDEYKKLEGYFTIIRNLKVKETCWAKICREILILWKDIANNRKVQNLKSEKSKSGIFVSSEKIWTWCWLDVGPESGRKSWCDPAFWRFGPKSGTPKSGPQRCFFSCDSALHSRIWQKRGGIKNFWLMKYQMYYYLYIKWVFLV